jgi:hypothetical protein
MATSYSTDLKLAIMATGENAGTWGQITNTNLNLLQQAIAGYENISIAGGAQTTALTMSNGAISNARNAVINLTGSITGNQVVTIPDNIEKSYIIINSTIGAFTLEFKTVSGSGVTWSTTDKSTKILYSNGTDVINTGLLSEIVQDTSPQLGGNLDVNGNSIVSTSNGNITLAPNGTGDVYLDADTIRIGDSNSSATLTTNGTGNLTINTNSGSNAGSVVFANGADGNITITPDGVGKIALVGGGKIKSLAETNTISATAATGIIPFDVVTQAVLYYTSAASGAFKINLRGSSSVSLNSYMTTGESISVAFLATQGATAYYTTNVQVDGTNLTPKWQGGTAPTKGNTSSVDIYTYTAIKTATSTFTVFASQTQFK